MRPFRLIILLAICVFTVTILLLFIAGQTNPHNAHSAASNKKSSVRAFFSFHSPLFPPSAIISLTDDNSTFFLARPAAFGPLLPNKGLSGQLWIGSGFGEDHMNGPGADSTPEGELGCSDAPGWDASLGRVRDAVLDGKLKQNLVVTGKDSASSKNGASASRRSTDTSADESSDTDDPSTRPTDDDGTDDYLHELSSDTVAVTNDLEVATSHADIQSLQESAEIAGKIVLLSRGGCGFLEKVKWAQRRGGVALIVGDDVRGGPLVTMYAKGDTSNVSIPALFTSHTTAHLLSSLMPIGGRIGGRPLLPISSPDTPSSKEPVSESKKKPQSKETKPQDRQDESSKTQHSDTKEKGVPKPGSSSSSSQGGFWSGMLSFLGFGSSDSHRNVNTRPPSSGSHDWIVEEFEEDKVKKPKTPSTEDSSKSSSLENTSPLADDFVIGVHDWRDPDLLKKPSNGQKLDSQKKLAAKRSTKPPLKGGSITPGSGEYTGKKGLHAAADESRQSSAGWKSHLPWSGDNGHATHESTSKKTAKLHTSKPQPKPPSTNSDEPPQHEGLWVTLTPTNMSSSPFFDTILVLVISPLITLTIVYALLLLRSRIRRRRWRAPKSVVDRLPVRTYHTLSNDSSPASLATPLHSTPTTPLLQSSTGARVPLSRSQSRSRPRARTTSEIHDQASTSSPLLEDSDNASITESEKRERGLAEWRRRYGGRQKECVVCLEEYVDGVSRVMSLPCGHEFHAECITPWLTTRRRTCPICKGDVVRSMARSTGTSASATGPSTLSRQSSFGRALDEAEDDIQAQAAGRRNDSPSAQDPVPVDDDSERGIDARIRFPQADFRAWRDWGFDVMGIGDRVRRRARELDRDR